jgi:hypothetical protein
LAQLRGLEASNCGALGKTAFRQRSAIGIAALVFAAAVTTSMIAAADEGGVSFWIPGFFGSLAAAPRQPVWSLANIYYHTSVSAGSNVALGQVGTSAAATATTDYLIGYNTIYNWTTDIPGVYSLVVNYTLTAP